MSFNHDDSGVLRSILPLRGGETSYGDDIIQSFQKQLETIRSDIERDAYLEMSSLRKDWEKRRLNKRWIDGEQRTILEKSLRRQRQAETDEYVTQDKGNNGASQQSQKEESRVETKMGIDTINEDVLDSEVGGEGNAHDSKVFGTEPGGYVDKQLRQNESVENEFIIGDTDEQEDDVLEKLLHKSNRSEENYASKGKNEIRETAQELNKTLYDINDNSNPSDLKQGALRKKTSDSTKNRDPNDADCEIEIELVDEDDDKQAEKFTGKTSPSGKKAIDDEDAVDTMIGESSVTLKDVAIKPSFSKAVVELDSKEVTNRPKSQRNKKKKDKIGGRKKGKQKVNVSKLERTVFTTESVSDMKNDHFGKVEKRDFHLKEEKEKNNIVLNIMKGSIPILFVLLLTIVSSAAIDALTNFL